VLAAAPVVQRSSGLLLLCVTALVGCSTDIADLNARPAKFYQEKVTFSGRITRVQRLSAEMLLEVASARERRILVRTATPPDADVGDWVKVTGVLVPEARVGDTTLYDVVVAESISKRRPPWLRNLT